MARKTPEAFETNDPLITEVRERMSHGREAWKEIRDEGTTDMLCVSGRVWEALDPTGYVQRGKAKRPMITADELNQYFNQAINGVRANPRAVKFSPVGNGASEEAAEFYANKMREIEYRSHAQIAYITAFENAVQRSYGYVRVNTRYESERSANQDIWIDPVPNPDMVILDPDGLRPDSSDIQWGIVFETWTQSELKRKFGSKLKITDFSGHMEEAPQWISAKDEIVLAEYWKIKTKPRKLYMLTGPAGEQTVFEDELKDAMLPEGFEKGVFLRDVDYPQVCQYLTNGLEIIEEKEWAGKYIPIASCYGKVLYVDSGGQVKRVMLSMTRLAREPYMLYCYYRTTQAELVGMTPKTPYMAYEGQLDAKNLTEIQRSLHEPVAVVFAKPTVEFLQPGTVLPLPQRQPYRPEIELLEIGAEGARRAIQAAMATNFMPTQAQRRNEKSGKALDKIDEVSQRGSFHFNDHYDDMIRHVGVMVEDLMDKIYDTKRDVGIRKPNDEAEIITINAPAQDKEGKPYEINTKGDYQATVSTGPAFDSQQEQASELADWLLQNEALAPRVADIAVRLKAQGPLIDELVERITPPEFQKKKDGQPDPRQMMQMVQQQQAELQNLKKVASELALTLKSKKLEIESSERIAFAEIASKEKIAGSKDETALSTTAMKLEGANAIAIMEAQLTEIQSKLAGHEAQLSRTHDQALAAQGHGASMMQGDQQHQQALEQGQQGQQNALEQADVQHQQALEQGQQGHQQALEQMAAQPPPSAGGSQP